mgnify:CR=1 FL=1
MDHCRAFVFFQAEDGIRDLVRSRGLGDVYKRQLTDTQFKEPGSFLRPALSYDAKKVLFAWCKHYPPVSYTHLTLPTSDLV